MLAGVFTRVLEQLELTESTKAIACEDIFLAVDLLGLSTGRAFDEATRWLSKRDSPLAAGPNLDISDQNGASDK